MIIVSRTINGIGLNGNEYLLDENGKAMEFTNIATAKEFLLENDISPEEIETFNFEKTENPAVFHKGIVLENEFEGEFWTFEVGLKGTDHVSIPYYISAKNGTTASKFLKEHIDTDLYEIKSRVQIF